MNKKLFKNIGFSIMGLSLVFSYAFLAEAKSSDEKLETKDKTEKTMKEISKEKMHSSEKANKKSLNFEAKGVIKSVDKIEKTISVLINKANGALLKEKKGQEEKFSADDKTKIRKDGIKLNFEELVPEMRVNIEGKKIDTKLMADNISIKTESFEAQGELKSVDSASRMIKVAVSKSKKEKNNIDLFANKEIDIKVLANAKIIKADEKTTLDSLKQGDRVNIKIMKIKEEIFGLKVVVKGSKSEKQENHATTTEGANTENTTPGTTAAPISISITNNGFTPNSVEVPIGTKVVWTNNSSAIVQPSSNPHPAHTDFPEFGTGPSLQPGQTFDFVFNKAMTFKYHDHLNSSSTGTIVVK